MTSWLFISEIETRRFGIRVARSRINQPTPTAEAIVDEARALEAAVSILRFESSERALPASLGELGTRFVHADTLVYFACDLDRLPPSRAAHMVIRNAVPEDETALARIATEGFRGYTSHYGASACFDTAKVEAGYVDWALGHLRGSAPEDDTWLVDQDGEAVGFATCRRNSANTEAEILLNAVLPAHQGRGVYRQLLGGLAAAYREAGLRRVSVSTQVWNTRVQRAWAALGFVPDRAYNTYHLGG